jgi:hypothetical protein
LHYRLYKPPTKTINHPVGVRRHPSIEGNSRAAPRAPGKLSRGIVKRKNYQAALGEFPSGEGCRVSGGVVQLLRNSRLKELRIKANFFQSDSRIKQ